LQAYIPDHIGAARRAAWKGLVVLQWLQLPPLAAAAFGVWTNVSCSTALAAALVALVMAALATVLWLRRDRVPREQARVARLGIACCLATGLSASAACLDHGVGWSGIGAYELAALAGLCGLYDRNALAVGVLLLLAEHAGLLVATPAFAPDITQGLALVTMMLTATATWLWLIRHLNSTVAAAEAEKKAAAVMEQALRLAAEAATDLSAQAAEDRLAHEFEQEIGARASQAALAAQGLRAASRQITEASVETSRRTLAIADSSRDTVASAREVAVSVDQLAASITSVTANVREVSDASFRAMDEATTANDTVKKLADAAIRIGHVVTTINNLARKTNMLALNATIEAARAGEAGRGFTIVASEVKALAHQTATATGDIEQEINTIQSEIAHAVAAIDGMAQTVAELGGSTVQAACTIDEQAEIAHSIAASAMRAADGTHQVVTNLDALTEATSRAEAAACEASQDADKLAEQCAFVEAKVREFVKSFLAA
jgi:methyl-accepting chemotaxis protein